MTRRPDTMDGGQRQGNHQRCQNDVRDEQAEVHASSPSLTSEGHRTNPVVVDQVGDKEQ